MEALSERELEVLPLRSSLHTSFLCLVIGPFFPAGRPEFPAKVIGSWICRGYMIGDGVHTTTGPLVTSTQTYNFGKEYGKVTLVMEGFELADKNVPVTRAVTGGTGQFRGARGEQSQILLGFTAQMGVNLRVSLDVQPR